MPGMKMQSQGGRRRKRRSFARPPYSDYPEHAGRSGRYSQLSYDWRASDYEYQEQHYSDAMLDYLMDLSLQGPFRGRGPRGYQRSDDRICEEVCQRLAQHGQLDPSDIEVSVENCEVTLTGQVDSRPAKRLAEDIAYSVTGVREVHNRLILSLPPDSPPAPVDAGSIQPGMAVYGRRGRPIGLVRIVRQEDFLLERDEDCDIYVPLQACQGANGHIRLKLSRDELDDQDWPSEDCDDEG